MASVLRRLHHLPHSPLREASCRQATELCCMGKHRILLLQCLAMLSKSP